MRSIACRALALVCLVARPAAGEEPAGASPPLSPQQALAAFTLPDDLQVDPVLSEPEVRQPLAMSFDERGRLWVVQYLQYPLPAGLKILSQDKFLRATYDKVPSPPPNHFPGLDKITIHEDTDGDGTFDTHKTFLEGLNIATSIARGRGGVWLLNPPYLLFYPDRDNDDVPDGDPEVHLSGFGLEDTHSVANSLQWGPDGWLYAAQGSTVSGAVLRPGLDTRPVDSLGQLIWRYQPEQRRYEIFAEGGGNAFGIEFDAQGRIYSGHNGGDTRGFHYVQGGYYQKGFSKHGPLSNPYSFGYFPAMKHHRVPRFTHTFVIYEAGALGAAYQGKLFAVAPLLSHVVYSRIEPDGSSFKTADLGHALASSDTCFRPVDIKVGPDGAIYVADMYEQQIAHLRHHEGQIDKHTGRIYRLRAKGAAPPANKFDLGSLSSRELVELLDHEFLPDSRLQQNKWFRQTALRLLGDRRDASIVPLLAQRLAERTGQPALELLWALHLCGGLDETAARMALAHVNPYVRAWSVRLLGDERTVSPAIAALLAEMARREPNVEVRSQLACTARRLPADQSLPVVRALCSRDEDAADIHLPLLLWWAIESKADSDREALLALFEEKTIWQTPLVAEHLVHRLMRRYAQAGTRKDLLTCARLLEIAPDEPSKQRLMRGFEEAFEGRPVTGLPEELAAAMVQVSGQSLAFSLRQGQPEAVERALATIGDMAADGSERLTYIRILGEAPQPQSVPVLLAVLRTSSDEALKMAALTALQPYADAQIASAVIELYGQFTDEVRLAAQLLLSSREPWTLFLLSAVDDGRIDPRSVPTDVVRKITAHRHPEVARLVGKHWGDIEGATSAEMRQRIATLESAVRSGSGSPYEGKKLFSATCAKCHKLFGEGGQIGPDLTSHKRDDLAGMLVNIVNPSAEVREGFESLQVITDDGRVASGFLVDRDNQVMVLRGADGQNVTIRQEQIDEMAPLARSLMPEGLLADFSDQQVRDLMAYLRSSQPLNE